MEAIPDSTDWLNTPLSALADVENALHCQICKEFYDTPMITSCHHTFCSKCIRTSLSADGRCPACRASDQASKLRNNWAIQEVVTTFIAARPATLKVARDEREAASGTRRGKRKRTVLDSDDVAEVAEEGRTTRRKSRRLAASQTSQPDTVTVDDSDEDETFAPVEPPDDGLVECPLGCGKRMKIDAVEPHLDRCEDEQQEERRAKLRPPFRLAPRTAPKAQERISEPNYSMLNDLAMRRKLKDAGLSNTGVKQLMIKRYTEWVNLWNANCDSSDPRSRREIMRDLETWERTQGGKAHVPAMSSSVMRKDFDGADWANSNKDDFSRLIADARKKRASPASGAATLEPSTGPAEVAIDGPASTNAVDSAQPSSQSAEQINGNQAHAPDPPHQPQSERSREQTSTDTAVVVQSPPGGFEERSPSAQDDPSHDVDAAHITRSDVSAEHQPACAPQLSSQSSPSGKKPPMFAISAELEMQDRGGTAMEIG
ncbi:E3 ubiquitin-protein ligase rad18 [Oleoguttula sp. CCFEE 5521]